MDVVHDDFASRPTRGATSTSILGTDIIIVVSPAEENHQDASDITGEQEKEEDKTSPFNIAEGNKSEEKPSEAAGDSADQTNEEKSSDAPAPKDDVNSSATVSSMEQEQDCGESSTTLNNPKEVQDVTEQRETAADLASEVPREDTVEHLRQDLEYAQGGTGTAAVEANRTQSSTGEKHRDIPN